MTIDDEKIALGFSKRPHVVILGAGASIASLPNGDKNGFTVPVMDNTVEVLGLDGLLSNVDFDTKSNNLESIFSELSEKPEYCSIKNEIETVIYQYFSSLTIPYKTIIYDLLLLSLKKKDCIASFNWDDLILQSWQRVSKIVGIKNMPTLIFLHGNVGVGYCPQDLSLGCIHNICKYCGSEYKPSKLLYPIKSKNYQDEIIEGEWKKLSRFLNNASILTIFGYRCPETDIEARKILLNAFDCFKGDNRFLDQIEIIEKPGSNKNEIKDKWIDFIKVTKENFEIYDSFFDSILARAPRRSAEYLSKSSISGWWGEPQIFFKSTKLSFRKISNTIKPLIDAENNDVYEVI
ncbi:MAG: hypothetical protein CVU12_02730 [Bacteroidetes bacterium HGW-Bacteroidetes-7]|jgi:hypothetical protein|nr:MAG: hypothetical protein CVU12_02730 [Bacteroidetes bacterium HGW-Bacteroidetes-7]